VVQILSRLNGMGKQLGIFAGGLIIVVVAVGAFIYGDQRRQQVSQGTGQTEEQSTSPQENNSQSPPEAEPEPEPTPNPEPLPDLAPNNNNDPETEPLPSSSANLPNNNQTTDGGSLANAGPEDNAAFITTLIVLLALKYRRDRRRLNVG
jgi:hypothetical protein